MARRVRLAIRRRDRLIRAMLRAAEASGSALAARYQAALSRGIRRPGRMSEAHLHGTEAIPSLPRARIRHPDNNRKRR